MPRYALKREGEVVREEEREGSQEAREVLREAMKEAWRTPELQPKRRKLSEIARKWWKPQIEEALKVTGYSKELESRAREIEYDKKVKKVWE